jgi:hypothetical protein
MKNLFSFLFVTVPLLANANTALNNFRNTITSPGYNIDTNKITLQNFSVNKTGISNELRWQVNCLSTSVTFELQRSANLQNFESIYTENATKERCASAFIYTDTKPLNGANYYRLKIIDIDGSISLSKISLLVNDSKAKGKISLETNRISVDAVINYTSLNAEKIIWIITDMQGRIAKMITTAVTAGENKIRISTADISAGQYQIKGYTTQGKTDGVRFVKGSHL